METENILEGGLLKDAVRRHIYRPRSEVDGTPVVVKKFHLESFRDKVKARRYGWQEYQNYRMAEAAGVPIPRLLAFFEQRQCGIIKLNGVVMEYLDGYQPLQPDQFSLAVPALVLLYQKGINHIDLSPTNILRHPDTGEMRIIDWQYCSTATPRDDRQLLYHASHFAELSECAVDSPEIIDFFEALYAAWKPSFSEAAFIEAVTRLSSERHGRKERLQLNVPSEVKTMVAV